MTETTPLQRLRHEDGWQSSLTGLGLGRDPSLNTKYGAPCWRSPSELTDIYRYNWLARKLVEALPYRSLARGVDESTPLPDRFDELNFAKWDEGALMRACAFGRLYGGSHLFIGYAGGGQDLLQPVNGSPPVAFLDVFTRHELTPARIVAPGGQTVEARDIDPLSPTFGEITHWQVTGDNPRHGLIYHRSRAIPFGGNSLPPRISYGPVTRWDVELRDRDWSDSVLLSCWDDVQRYGVFWQSVSYLIQVSSVGVLKVAGLIEALAHESGQAMRDRVDILNTALAITRNLLLDASQNEDYKREAVSFADVPALLDQMMIATAGAFGMPTTELFGRAPQGMNATGESDRVMWENRCLEWRQRVLRPRMNRLCSAIAQRNVEIEYPEIFVPTEKEKLEQRNLRMQGTERLWSMGVFSDQEIRDAERAGELVEMHATASDVPEDPTRAVVQIKSETEGGPGGNGPPAASAPPGA